jgi:hypothetical protein
MGCSSGGSSHQLVLCSDHFPADFASLGILNKDPSVWLDGARPPPVSFKVYFHSGENHTKLVHLKEHKNILNF